MQLLDARNTVDTVKPALINMVKIKYIVIITIGVFIATAGNDAVALEACPKNHSIECNEGPSAQVMELNNQQLHIYSSGGIIPLLRSDIRINNTTIQTDLSKENRQKKYYKLEPKSSQAKKSPRAANISFIDVYNKLDKKGKKDLDYCLSTIDEQQLAKLNFSYYNDGDNINKIREAARKRHWFRIRDFEKECQNFFDILFPSNRLRAIMKSGTE